MLSSQKQLSLRNMMYQDLKAYRKIGGNRTFVGSIKHLKTITCFEGYIISLSESFILYS